VLDWLTRDGDVVRDTHDYILLKYADLLAKGRVTFCCHYRDENGDLQCEEADTLAGLRHNPVLDAIEELCNMELERTMDGVRE